MALFGDTLSLALQNLLDERRAREVARRDSLTALYNDRYFHKKLQQEIDRLAGGADGDLTLLFLDCDHLKAVNDEHGHLAGSQILREVAFVLQRQLAATTSLPCRYGGDEFTVILLDCNLAQGVGDRRADPRRDPGLDVPADVDRPRGAGAEAEGRHHDVARRRVLPPALHAGAPAERAEERAPEEGRRGPLPRQGPGKELRRQRPPRGRAALLLERPPEDLTAPAGLSCPC